MDFVIILRNSVIVDVSSKFLSFKLLLNVSGIVQNTYECIHSFGNLF